MPVAAIDVDLQPTPEAEYTPQDAYAFGRWTEAVSTVWRNRHGPDWRGYDSIPNPAMRPQLAYDACKRLLKELKRWCHRPADYKLLEIANNEIPRTPPPQGFNDAERAWVAKGWTSIVREFY
jgi:hypothetical protein